MTFSLTQHVLTLAIIAIQISIGLIVYYGLDTFIYPLTAAIILLYMSLPAIHFLEHRLKIPPTVAIGTIFFLQLILISFILIMGIPYLLGEARNLIQQLPTFFAYFFESLEEISKSYDLPSPDNSFGKIPQGLLQTLQSISQLDPATIYRTLVLAQGTAGQLLSPLYWIAYMLLMPIMYFFLALNTGYILPIMRKFTPVVIRPYVIDTLKIMNEVFSGYFRGQITVIFFLTLLYSTSLHALGIPYGSITGIITGLLSFVPYLGIISGFTIASISLFYTSSKLTGFIALTLTFILINMIESLFLTPTFMGKRVGLSNTMSLLSMIIGANLFGVFGLIFAIPITATCKLLFIKFAGFCRHKDVL